MLIRRLAVLPLLLLIAACATPESIRLAEPPTAPLSGKQVHVAREKTPDFSAMTAGKSMFGLVGAIATIAAGNNLVRENGVEDPAETIEQALIRHLRASYGTAGSARAIEFDEEKPKDLGRWARDNNVAGVIVDVQTVNWGLVYFPTVWSKYRVQYLAHMRMIDVANGEVIAQHQCGGITPDESDNAPTYEDLTANRAAGLKTMLDDWAKLCIDEVMTTVL